MLITWLNWHWGQCVSMHYFKHTVNQPHQLSGVLPTKGPSDTAHHLLSLLLVLTSKGSAPFLTSSMFVMLNIHTLKMSGGASASGVPLNRAVKGMSQELGTSVCVRGGGGVVVVVHELTAEEWLATWK